MSETLFSSEETTFPVDDVSKIIKSAVEEVIERNTYQHSKVKQWADKIVEQVLSNLKDLNKPFKYIATCVIMQKNGAGLHTASSCYWDNTTDDHLPDSAISTGSAIWIYWLVCIMNSLSVVILSFSSVYFLENIHNWAGI